ncbi:hypothetical protein S40293_05110 [Stachybotrys chartarum IBT 40293]|nr:hypothetical protein S40293_05110 [Stachybotrys chartarum IBT 40293]
MDPNFQIRHWPSYGTRRAVFALSPQALGFENTGSGFRQSCYSTLSGPPVEYGYVDGVEDLSDYRPGGYHPIHIDDRLNKRYRIVHKLGHGTFSTAWLAIDEKTSAYVAVKVGAADADRTEIDVLSYLTESDARFKDSVDKPSPIPLVLDRFHLGGPSGTHPCLVTVPARCSLRNAREASGSYLFQLDVARSLAAQLVTAVSLVHSQGYAHGGEAKLILSDFGVAFRPSDKSRFESYTPLVLRPPEAFFEPETPLTFASDIWSLGCVIFELLAHRSLIDGFLAPQDEITAQQVELQGPMPPEWWVKWEKRPKWYDEAGKPLSNESDIWSWERRFEQWVQSPRRSRGMETIPDDERDALFKLLGWMLAWRPNERPDVKAVLEADWVTKWALPAFQKGLEGC